MSKNAQRKKEQNPYLVARDNKLDYVFNSRINREGNLRNNFYWRPYGFFEYLGLTGQLDRPSTLSSNTKVVSLMMLIKVITEYTVR